MISLKDIQLYDKPKRERERVEVTSSSVIFPRNKSMKNYSCSSDSCIMEENDTIYIYPPETHTKLVPFLFMDRNSLEYTFS